MQTHSGKKKPNTACGGSNLECTSQRLVCSEVGCSEADWITCRLLTSSALEVQLESGVLWQCLHVPPGPHADTVDEAFAEVLGPECVML